MNPLPIADLMQVGRSLSESGKRVNVLWQQPDSLAFIARGREYRSEFHINASDEFTYMIKGTMNLHYRDESGKEGILVIPEGSTNFMPGNVPHSPRFPPDAFALIVERGRREGEVDRFQWFCPKCDSLLHEERAVVDDYKKDFVTRAYANFFDNEQHRTCKKCGNVMPKP